MGGVRRSGMVGWVFGWGCSGAFAVAAADGRVEAGKTRFAPCASCHQADARGGVAKNAPQLAGQEAWFLSRQITKLRDGIRQIDCGDEITHADKKKVLATVTDQDVLDLAAYLASLPVGAKHPATLGGDATKGKVMYVICAACHGAKGEGNRVLSSPRLTGVQDWYVKRQLQNFKSGKRGAHAQDTEGAQMRPMAMSLSDDAKIDDVTAYLRSLP